jgi:hypothetical protein
MSKKLALIDADILVYLAGFACQKTLWTHKPSGSWFEGKLAANAWFKEEYQCPAKGSVAWMKKFWIDAEWDSEIKVEPWTNCQWILDNKIFECIRANGMDDARLFFSPKKTFRDEVAITLEYKANRKPNKPEYAKKIVEYLNDTYICETGDGVEADDLMGIYQTKDTVICTNDKDLKMIAGKHYNFATKKEEDDPHDWVDEFDADMWFLTQLIAGDSVDNIQGIPGWGVTKAQKLVDSFETDISGLIEEIELMYADQYCATWREVMDEHAALVWILRAGETPETAGWRQLLHKGAQ